jgi:hypothetical protein
LINASDLVPYSEFNKTQKKIENKQYSINKIKEKFTYRLDGNLNTDINKWLISKEYYDTIGRLTKFESIDEFDEVALTNYYKYNSENMLTEIEERDKSNNLIQLQVFSYDPFDKLKQIVSYDTNKNINQKMVFEYIDEKGVAIETIMDSSDKVISYTIHLYDKPFNRIIKSTNFLADNEIDGTTVIHYVDEGVNSREVYTKDITEPFRIKYQNIYDQTGNLSEVRNLSYPNTLLVTVKHKYVDFKLLESTSMYDSKGNLITTISYEYFKN